MTNILADQLNQQIRQENSSVYNLLSTLGKSSYLPTGILTQSAESKQRAYRFNATIGIATENGRPMYLPVIHDTLSYYAPEDLYDYAPPAGKAELRKVWREKMLLENPSLAGKSIGTPLVTNALTHGLSILADLFVDPGDVLILPDKLWGNYNFIFGVRCGAQTTTYPLYTANGSFNTEGLKNTLLAQKDIGKAIVLLNFPNNPTGYTPSETEANAIVSVLMEAADQGIDLLCISDDAYFGLFFEDSITESLFSRLANCHPRILAVKVDGATKEDFVWGLRVGFVTYASDSSTIIEALEKKTIGIIRGTISNASNASQTFVLHALQSPEFKSQKLAKFKILKGRAIKVKSLLHSGKYDDGWTYYPFNSGYFMCLRLKKVNAELLRKHLLDKYGVGVISLNETDVRVAFSSVEEQDLEELFDLIYAGIKDLTQST